MPPDEAASAGGRPRRHRRSQLLANPTHGLSTLTEEDSSDSDEIVMERVPFRAYPNNPFTRRANQEPRRLGSTRQGRSTELTRDVPRSAETRSGRPAGSAAGNSSDSPAVTTSELSPIGATRLLGIAETPTGIPTSFRESDETPTQMPAGLVRSDLTPSRDTGNRVRPDTPAGISSDTPAMMAGESSLTGASRSFGIAGTPAGVPSTDFMGLYITPSRDTGNRTRPGRLAGGSFNSPAMTAGESSRTDASRYLRIDGTAAGTPAVVSLQDFIRSDLTSSRNTGNRTRPDRPAEPSAGDSFSTFGGPVVTGGESSRAGASRAFGSAGTLAGISLQEFTSRQTGNSTRPDRPVESSAGSAFNSSVVTGGRSPRTGASRPLGIVETPAGIVLQDFTYLVLQDFDRRAGNLTAAVRPVGPPIVSPGRRPAASPLNGSSVLDRTPAFEVEREGDMSTLPRRLEISPRSPYGTMPSLPPSGEMSSLSLSDDMPSLPRSGDMSSPTRSGDMSSPLARPPVARSQFPRLLHPPPSIPLPPLPSTHRSERVVIESTASSRSVRTLPVPPSIPSVVNNGTAPSPYHPSVTERVSPFSLSYLSAPQSSPGAETGDNPTSSFVSSLPAPRSWDGFVFDDTAPLAGTTTFARTSAVSSAVYQPESRPARTTIGSAAGNFLSGFLPGRRPSILRSRNGDGDASASSATRPALHPRPSRLSPPPTFRHSPPRRRVHFDLPPLPSPQHSPRRSPRRRRVRFDWASLRITRPSRDHPRDHHRYNTDGNDSPDESDYAPSRSPSVAASYHANTRPNQLVNYTVELSDSSDSETSSQTIVAPENNKSSHCEREETESVSSADPIAFFELTINDPPNVTATSTQSRLTSTLSSVGNQSSDHSRHTTSVESSKDQPQDQTATSTQSRPPPPSLAAVEDQPPAQAATSTQSRQATPSPASVENKSPDPLSMAKLDLPFARRPRPGTPSTVSSAEPPSPDPNRSSEDESDDGSPMDQAANGPANESSTQSVASEGASQDEVPQVHQTPPEDHTEGVFDPFKAFTNISLSPSVMLDEEPRQELSRIIGFPMDAMDAIDLMEVVYEAERAHLREMADAHPDGPPLPTMPPTAGEEEIKAILWKDIVQKLNMDSGKEIEQAKAMKTAEAAGQAIQSPAPDAGTPNSEAAQAATSGMTNNPSALFGTPSPPSPPRKRARWATSPGVVPRRTRSMTAARSLPAPASPTISRRLRSSDIGLAAQAGPSSRELGEPESWGKASVADKRLSMMKDAGKGWAEITVMWNGEAGQNKTSKEVTKRWGRVKGKIGRWSGFDDALRGTITNVGSELTAELWEKIAAAVSAELEFDVSGEESALRWAALEEDEKKGAQKGKGKGRR